MLWYANLKGSQIEGHFISKDADNWLRVNRKPEAKDDIEAVYAKLHPKHNFYPRSYMTANGFKFYELKELDHGKTRSAGVPVVVHKSKVGNPVPRKRHLRRRAKPVVPKMRKR
jgi:hypothetical protein